jgi:hypothetical protein
MMRLPTVFIAAWTRHPLQRSLSSRLLSLFPRLIKDNGLGTRSVHVWDSGRMLPYSACRRRPACNLVFQCLFVFFSPFVDADSPRILLSANASSEMSLGLGRQQVYRGVYCS